jgi:hypothetical protein
VSDLKRLSLVKPTLDTPFHIDFDWWKQNDRDWRIYLHSYLCAEHQKALAGMDSAEKVDWIDPYTAEVQRVDGLHHILITHCAKQMNFITHQTTVVDGVFQTFLANSNKPLSPNQLAEQLGKPAATILKTFSGMRVYKGIRPYIG